MPRRKSARRLEEMCVDVIVKNISNLNVNWNKEDFQLLPVSFTEKIVEEMKKNSVRVPESRLDLFIHHRIKKLNYGDWTLHNEYSGTLNNLLSRCSTDLTHLNLNSCNKISQLELSNVVCNIPKILNLNLGKTKCDDVVTELIGIHCPLIRKLDITLCNVTDMGINLLCIDAATRSSRDLNITSLSILQTKISEQGGAIALKYLRKLKMFFYDHAETSLMILNEEEEPLILPLESFHQRDQPKFLKVVAKLCPNVKELTVIPSTDDDLNLLSTFQHLESLSLRPCPQFRTSFSDGFVSMFEAMGSKLTDLSLALVTGVDVATLGSCCPQLKKLNLISNTYFSSNNNSNKNNAHPQELFCNLRHVGIQCDNNISFSHMKLLLSCCRLESCELYFCDTLTDSLFTCVVEARRMSRLRHLHLYRCSLVTNATIKLLLNTVNDLKQIVVGNCFHIKKEDYFRCFTQANNLDVEINWME